MRCCTARHSLRLNRPTSKQSEIMIQAATYRCPAVDLQGSHTMRMVRSSVELGVSGPVWCGPRHQGKAIHHIAAGKGKRVVENHLKSKVAPEKVPAKFHHAINCNFTNGCSGLKHVMISVEWRCRSWVEMECRPRGCKVVGGGRGGSVLVAGVGNTHPTNKYTTYTHAICERAWLGVAVGGGGRREQRRRARGRGTWQWWA